MERLRSAILVCALVLLAAQGAAAQQASRSVIVLRPSGLGSVGPGFSETASSFRNALKAASPVRVYLENLDFTNFSGQNYQAATRAYLHDKYRDIPIDVIVTLGPPAFEFAWQMRSERWPDIPIVFAAVDERSIELVVGGATQKNFTGRSLQFSLEKSVGVAKALVPDLKQIVLVGDRLERQALRRGFIKELPQVTQSLSVIDLTGRPLAEIKEAVAALPRNSAILYTAATSDGAGNDLLSYEMSQIIAANSTRPMVVDMDNRLGRGGTGGFVVHNDLVGKETAELVLRVLDGESAGRIPITPSNAIKPTFDWQQLQRLGISESLLPANSIVLFRTPTIWEQYRWRLILAFAAVGLQSALIFGLVYEDRRRRTAEDDAHSLLAKLERRNRFAAAGELTASIAHEIRQPLTSIVVAAEAGLNWLKNEVPDLKEARSSLTNIVKEGHRADDVIRNVRAMFSNDRQEQGPIDVSTLIEEVLALAARTLQNNDVRVKTMYAQKSIVRGNSVQLQQVLMNLINNAVEAMSSRESNDRLLQLKTERLGSGDQISIVVQDSGPGIDPERRADLFKPLFSTKPGGMGLGLTICRSVIDAHGGSLTATAANPIGTVFTIILPLERERT